MRRSGERAGTYSQLSGIVVDLREEGKREGGIMEDLSADLCCACSSG